MYEPLEYPPGYILPERSLVSRRAFLVGSSTLGTATVVAAISREPIVQIAQVLTRVDPISYPYSIEEALAFLSQNPATQDLPEIFLRNRIRIEFRDLVAELKVDVYAKYSSAQRKMIIDQRWEDARPVGLAGILAHEGEHVKQGLTGLLAVNDSETCVRQEIEAFAAQNLFLLNLFPDGQIPFPQDDLELNLNKMVRIQRNDPLGLKRAIEGYSYCTQ